MQKQINMFVEMFAKQKEKRQQSEFQRFTLAVRLFGANAGGSRSRAFFFRAKIDSHGRLVLVQNIWSCICPPLTQSLMIIRALESFWYVLRMYYVRVWYLF